MDFELIDRSLESVSHENVAKPTEEEAEVVAASDRPKEGEMDDKIAKVPVQDPLKWFGIFVPPSLRTSQKHFSESVRLIVEDVMTHDSHLKALEIEIRRTKKQLSKLQ